MLAKSGQLVGLPSRVPGCVCRGRVWWRLQLNHVLHLGQWRNAAWLRPGSSGEIRAERDTAEVRGKKGPFVLDNRSFPLGMSPRREGAKTRRSCVRTAVRRHAYLGSRSWSHMMGKGMNSVVTSQLPQPLWAFLIFTCLRDTSYREKICSYSVN